MQGSARIVSIILVAVAETACADSIDIELEEPLGDRRVVDGTSGDELAVIGRD